jgi:hypothetical protein
MKAMCATASGGNEKRLALDCAMLMLELSYRTGAYHSALCPDARSKTAQRIAQEKGAWGGTSVY